MTIKLPKSGGEYLEAITACGRIKAKYLDKSNKKDVRLYAKLKGGGRVGVIVSKAANDKDMHFHLDVFGRSYLKGGKRRGRVNAKFSEVAGVIERFVGKPIEVVTTGRFSVPLNKISEHSITQLLLRVSAGQTASARLIGALYDVEPDDDPVMTVQWHKIDEGESAELKVVIESVSETAVNSDYLESLAAPLEAALRTIILE